MNSTNTYLCETNVGAAENTVCTTFRTKCKRIIAQVRHWMYLHIWCRYCYRSAMRLLHRFNLHYAPPSVLSPEYGIREHWCQWCGLRGKTFSYDPSAPLSPTGSKEDNIT